LLYINEYKLRKGGIFSANKFSPSDEALKGRSAGRDL
jgi:hypothetical protein